MWGSIQETKRILCLYTNSCIWSKLHTIQAPYQCLWAGVGSLLYQTNEDGMDRVVAYSSTTLSKSERNYPAHKLEFLALKWAMMDFSMSIYMVESLLYAQITTLYHVFWPAKLDVIGQCWVSSLANYNFQLHCKSGKSNVEADALSQILWDRQSSDDVHLDCNVVRAVIVGCSLETPLFEAYTRSSIHTKCFTLPLLEIH